jgi:competence protein ComEC
VVVPFLRRRGADHLASVILTHGDADHVGGVPAVLRSLGATLVLDPGQPLASALYGEYLATVDAMGADWNAARAGDTITVDSVVFAVLHPESEWMEHQFEPNENSVVIHLRYGCFDALLSGDIGHVVERALLRSVPKVEVLKVGHHGSQGSTSLAWLQALEPSAAVISVGRNRFGHPAPTVLELLRSQGIGTWRTDAGGTVTIRTDGRYLRIRQESQGRVRCLIRRLLRSSGSSSSRSGCTLRPPVTLPICSTPSPLPAK